MSAPTATRMIASAGTVGWRTAEMLWANRIHSHRPVAMPTGTPTSADDCGDRRLRCDGGGELAAGEAERLQEREVSASSSYRRGQREAERDDRTEREGGGEEDGRVPMDR